MTKRGLLVTAFMLSMLMLPLTTSVQAQEDDLGVSISASVDYNSKYIWRGINFTDGSVLQPAVEVGIEPWDGGSLTGGIWANVAIDDDVADEDGLTEVDYYVDLTQAFGEDDNFSVSAGYILYEFPQLGGQTLKGDARYTDEVYIGGATSVEIGEDQSLDLGLTLYRDIDDFTGEYYEASVGTTYAFADNVAFTPGVVLGYWNDYADIGQGWGPLQFVLGFDVTLNEYLSMAPSLTYSIELEQTALMDDEIWAGIGFGFSY